MNTNSFVCLLFLVCFNFVDARLEAQRRFGPRAPEYLSHEVSEERKITFRVYAPKAETVRLTSSDLPGIGNGAELKKGENDIWEVTTDPVPAGAYRYQFNVDGVSLVDPQNTSTSESNTNLWSLVRVPGSELFDVQDVPHGAVAEVTYRSQSLDRFRRLHVYTPPGYEQGQGDYPVLYLLHGAMDGDDSWSSVGQAGSILDNLIAAGIAKPMIVVMPHGHTGTFSFGGAGGVPFDRQMQQFQQDFVEDIKPLVEKQYRVKADRAHRALAGLSMGGAQTLDIGFAHLDEFGYLGVFSSGVFGIAGGFGGSGPDNRWEKAHLATLDDESLKPGTKLIWFATGKDDFLLGTTQATVKMLEDHKFDVTFKESEGGHTWLNWRKYLGEFAPLLFAGE